MTKLYTVLILALLCCKAYGAVEPYQQQLKGRIRNGDTLLLRDEKFRNTAYDWSLIVNRKVSNHITFGLLMDSVYRIRKPFTAKLDMKVEYWSQPDQADPVTEDHITLDLQYDTAYGAYIKPQDVYRFLNGHRVKITVNSISSPELGDDLPGIFVLTSQLFVDRKYLPDPNAPEGQIFVTPTTGQQGGSGGIQLLRAPVEQTANKVVLNWNRFDNSEEYDLEWTFVDETSANGLLLNNQANWTDVNLAKIFRNNATRVTVSEHTYTINLVHYSKYLLVRLRGVTTNTEQIRIEGTWKYKITYTEAGQSAVEQPGVIVLNNTWHHPDMNWQYNATYAEEGKRKEIVTYFDKSLKSRQAVTLTNNSTDPTTENKINVVVQSTIYDQYGRPALNVLPAPITGNVLDYYPGQNKKTGGTPYTFMDVNPGGKLCNFTFPQMENTAGAARYYSASNPFQAEPYHKFVPDAEGYPFSGQFYTNDNTGRISVQGGVGKVFQPNADPSLTTTKATRYYYSKPTQYELFRMFGNDVGAASHYSKTTTIDPNGQISISYQNLSGKTIATALSGPAPDNVDPLDGAAAARKEKQFTLFDGSEFTFDPSKLTLTASQTYIVQETGAVSFNIDVPRILARYEQTGICAECAYEGVLSISNDCESDPNTTFTINGSAASTNCVTLSPALFTRPVPASFNRKGAYYITLELRLKENVIKQAGEQYVTLNTSLKKQFDFVIEQLQATDFGGCFDDCKTCYTALGVKTNFITRIKDRLTSLGVNVTANAATIDAWAGPLYDQLSAACTASRATCSDNPCGMLENQMKADVSPGGQYALFDANRLPLERDINVLHNNWRLEFLPLNPGDNGYDADMVRMDDGTLMSVHDKRFTLEDLVAYWKPEWAAKFTKYHPEFCALEVCKRNSAYLDWDERIKSFALTAADIPVVLPGQQYDRNTPAWLVSSDPYFAAGARGQNYKTAFIADLQNYSVNVKKISGKSNKTVTQFVDFMLYCLQTDGAANATPTDDFWTDCSPVSGCRIADREWQLYLQMYMELKQYYYQKDRNENECVAKCKVGETLGLSGCPSVNAFSLTGGTVTGSLQAVTVRHEGGPVPKQTVVTFFYPNEYSGLTQVATVTFPAGQSLQTINIHANIPVNRVGVKSVTCTPGTPTYVCNGTSYVLDLGSSGRKAGRYVWEHVTVSGTLKTYYAVAGNLSQQPATPAGCANGVKNFYNCLRVKYSENGEGEYLQNVWLISCDATVCPSSQNYTALTMQTQNRFNISGAEIEIFPFTEPVNSLTSSRCANAVKSWYSCLTVNYNGTVYTYRNATVFTCTSGSGGPCGGNYITVNYSQSGTAYPGAIPWFYGNNITYIVSNMDISNCDDNVMVLPDPACVLFTGPNGDFPFENVTVKTCAGYSPPPGSTMMSGNSMSVMSVPDPGFNQSVTFSCAGMGRIAYQQFSGSGGRIYWKAGYTGADILPNGYVSANFVVSYASNGLPVIINYPVKFTSANMTQIVEFGINVAPAEAGSVTLTVIRPDCYAGGVSSGCDAYRSKQSRIVNVDFNTVPSVADMQAVGLGQMQAMTQSVCENQAESWLRQIDDCIQAYPAKRAALKDKLIALCKKGIDIKHPSGASTAPPGTTGTQSFKEVMVQELGSLSMDCNPWMIDAPYPYEAPAQNNSLVISKTDPDICAKLAALQSQAGSNLAQYLRTQFGSAMTLTDAQVADLVNSCGQCKYMLKADVELPVFLTPNTKGCITASELNAAYTALQAEGISNFSAAHRNYERVVTNYFNHRWGFTLGFPAYKKLLEAFPTTPNMQLCNEPLFNAIPEDPYDCLLAQVNHATRNGMMEYDKYIAEEKRKFRQAYIAACSQTKPVLKLTAWEGDYHYTLYYYDQAGQLVKTVPPAGVSLLTDAQIAAAQAATGPQAVCTYAGAPTTETPVSVTNTYVNTALASGSRSIEMWLYQPSLPYGQLLFTTGTNGYMLSACMGGQFMELDIYKLAPLSPGGVEFASSRHFSVKYVKNAELNWLHLVIQGTDLGSGTGNLDIYVNGEKATAGSGPVPTTCGWEMGFVNGSLVLPSNTALLKHIRGYSRSLTQTEISAQYGEACLGVSAALASTPRDHWGRHNIPVAGSPTTVGGTTNETQRSPVYPTHWLSTTYSFTSLGGVYKQHTPDANESKFWYDRLGRLVASRNAVQTDRTSYTEYDQQGRITEVGERSNGGTWTNTFLDNAQLDQYLTGSPETRKNITTTLYDRTYNEVFGQSPALEQFNLRKRVSASFVQQTPLSEKVLTAYSYDMLGNAQTVYQYINAQLGLKRLDYKYDLASGKVNAVRYRTGDGANDFFYNYIYDAENRLVKAVSGIEAGGDDWEIPSSTKSVDAEYYYYRHGPLARMELGKNKVQGVDYAYTLQGWLKAINGQLLDDRDASGNPVNSTSRDMGGDGFTTGVNSPFGRDVYAYTLDYYYGDYIPAVSNVFHFSGGYGTGTVPTQQLFNGNIARTTLTMAFGRANGNLNPMVGYTYRYDQLNRLKNMTHYADLMGSPTTESPLYSEKISYDPNGNIKTYKRAGNQAGANTGMDELTYQYKYNANGFLDNNRLNHINDLVPANRYTPDIDDQGPGNTNYGYDAIGNLVRDNQEKISKITWTVYGKIESIEKDNGVITYRYDAAGNRIYKESTIGGTKKTWYIRDAQGNTISTYSDNGTGNITWDELHLYGSSRLGYWKLGIPKSSPLATPWNGEGQKYYELTNHLGNVLAVVNDKNPAMGALPEVVNLQDYYAFGMQMPGRNYILAGASSYKYGFNGQEKSTEIDTDGNSYTAEFWQYDARIGRRWNLDPKPNVSFSWYSTLENSPIFNIDMLGDTTRPVLFFENESQYPNVYRVDMKYANLNPQHTYRVPLLNWTILHFNYESNKKNQEANRAATRKKFGGLKGSRASGLDAHEVAYASTKQGGNNSDTQMELIPAKENQDHGRELGRKITAVGSKDGDPIFVVLIPKPKRPSSLTVPIPQTFNPPFVRPVFKIKPITGYPGQSIQILIEELFDVKVPEWFGTPAPAPVSMPIPIVP